MSEKDSEERKLFDSTRSFKDRVRQWEVLIRAKMQQPQATNLLAIVTRIKNAQQMRDRIMHATWAGEAIPNSDDMTAKGVFNWTKPRQPFEWDLDFGKIMFVATTLDGIAYDLMAGIAQMTPKGKFMTLSEALQQILRKPDQSP